MEEVEEILFGNRTGWDGVCPSMQPETVVTTGITLHMFKECHLRIKTYTFTLTNVRVHTHTQIARSVNFHTNLETDKQISMVTNYYIQRNSKHKLPTVQFTYLYRYIYF